jgi:hypothetical protein
MERKAMTMKLSPPQGTDAEYYDTVFKLLRLQFENIKPHGDYILTLVVSEEPIVISNKEK